MHGIWCFYIKRRALIVKHKLRLDDRGTVEMIQENIYIQYFCVFKSFTTRRAFDPSLFVDIRKRLGGEEFDSFNKLVIEKAEQLKPHQSRIKSKYTDKSDDDETSSKPNQGTLKADATVADQEIRFPTDLNLLSISRENLERMIDLLYDAKKDQKKPRDYRRKARKEYLTISKKRRKGKNKTEFGSKIDVSEVDGFCRVDRFS